MGDRMTMILERYDVASNLPPSPLIESNNG